MATSNHCATVSPSVYDGLYGQSRSYAEDVGNDDDDENSDMKQNVVGKEEEVENHHDDEDDEDSDDDFQDDDEHDPSKQSATTSPTNANDTKRVVFFKVMVVTILIISATMIGMGIHRYIENSEQTTFEAKYHADANKVFAMIGSSIDKTLGTLNALSMLYVSYGNIDSPNSTTFPFVTIPNYALQISKMLHLTDGLYISVVPIVTPNEKQAFERYMYEQDGWVNDTFAVQDVWDGYHGNKSADGYNWSRNNHIYGVFGDIEDNVTRYMLPTWQSFPVAIDYVRKNKRRIVFFSLIRSFENQVHLTKRFFFAFLL
jgi:hypothetical protein